MRSSKKSQNVGPVNDPACMPGTSSKSTGYFQIPMAEINPYSYYNVQYPTYGSWPGVAPAAVSTITTTTAVTNSNIYTAAHAYATQYTYFQAYQQYIAAATAANTPAQINPPPPPPTSSINTGHSNIIANEPKPTNPVTFPNNKRYNYSQMTKKTPRNEDSSKSHSFAMEGIGISLMSVVLRCRACEVQCVGVDSYTSHIKGQRHSRAISKYFNQKHGLVIPSNMPQIVSKNIPKSLEEKIRRLYDKSDVPTKDKKDARENISEKDEDEEYSDNRKPIGYDFIEEVITQNGKLVCFTCTLCECQFNDANGKNLHLKGKRHRLQYKKKVDPNLSMESRKKEKKSIEKEHKSQLLLKASEQHFATDLNPFECEEHSRIFASFFNPNTQSTCKEHDFVRSFSDYLLEYKYQQISPEKPELECIYQTAHLIEKSIRIVGKFIELNFLIPVPLPKITSVHKTIMKNDEIEKLLPTKLEDLAKSNDTVVDFIRVIRSESLGQGITLKGEQQFEMVIYSSILPTAGLLSLFQQLVPEEIKNITSDKSKYPKEYSVSSELALDETMFKLSIQSGTSFTDSSKILHFNVYLTCPYIRDKLEEDLKMEEPDLLDHKQCLLSLAKVRHFRWFKEKSPKYSYFIFILRVLRDIAKRVEIWSKVSLWNIELILERIMISANCFLAPSSLFRYFFEFISHGILMNKGIGLADPCENPPTNIFNYLSKQEIEDLTCSAQHSTRLIAMRQLNKVLNIKEKDANKVRMDSMQLINNNPKLRQQYVVMEQQQQPPVSDEDESSQQESKQEKPKLGEEEQADTEEYGEAEEKDPPNDDDDDQQMAKVRESEEGDFKNKRQKMTTEENDPPNDDDEDPKMAKVRKSKEGDFKNKRKLITEEYDSPNNDDDQQMAKVRESEGDDLKNKRQKVITEENDPPNDDDDDLRMTKLRKSKEGDFKNKRKLITEEYDSPNNDDDPKMSKMRKSEEGNFKNKRQKVITEELSIQMIESND